MMTKAMMMMNEKGHVFASVRLNKPGRIEDHHRDQDINNDEGNENDEFYEYCQFLNNQGRAFASVHLNQLGSKNICALAVIRRSLR